MLFKSNYNLFLIKNFFITLSSFRLGSVRPPKRCRSDMDTTSASDIVIIHGNSHPDLANLVAERMGIKSGGCSVFHKTNRETMVEIGDSVRGKDIYIIQTGTK